MTDTAAADLRTKLDLALGEHIIFAATATVWADAALGGRTAEFATYGDLRIKNGTELGDMIGAVWTFGSTEGRHRPGQRLAGGYPRRPDSP